MRSRTLILWLVTVAVLAGSPARMVCADPVSDRAYKLKAAFLYNFVLFVDGLRFDRPGDGSKDESPDPNAPIVIGILGKDPFGVAFAPLKDKEIKNRRVVVKRFRSYLEIVDPNDPDHPRHPQIDDIRQCHVLFICPSEKDYRRIIVKSLGTRPILTVADAPGFLELGGMINFVIEEHKVRFEINTAATTRAGLRLRSKLLRLAKRVVRRDSLSATEREEDEVAHGQK